MSVHLLQNAGTEGAMNWVLGHMEDADFNDPLPSTSSAAQAPSSDAAADPESLMMLVSMGFTEQQATAALKVGCPALCICHARGYENAALTSSVLCMQRSFDA